MAVIHCWSRYTHRNPDALRRHKVAAASWSKQLWRECPIDMGQLPRSFKDNGTTALPFVGDLLDVASKDVPHDAILVLTNDDTVVSSDAALRIVEALQHRDACYAFRRDFYHHLTAPPADKDFAKGQDYCGSDLHAFRVRWWQAYRAFWPPLLLGREGWDWCLRMLMEVTCINKPLGLGNIICHERHANGWESPNIRLTLPSQKHNRALTSKFLARYNVHWP